MKATLKFLIESIFVASEMIELDLNDDESELTKAVVLKITDFARSSHARNCYALKCRRGNVTRANVVSRLFVENRHFDNA